MEAAEAPTATVAEDDAMEVEEFDEIEKLQHQGINAGDIKKLKDAGVHTIQGLQMIPRRKVANIKGLSDAKVEKILAAACALAPVAGWTNALSLTHKREKSIVKISTGAKEVDAILGGGYETQSITEMYGEFRCGKTQLCMTACVTTQLPVEEGGGAGKVAYIDTEGSFRPERLKPIAQRLGMDPEAIAENVLYSRATTFDSQEELLDGLCAIMVTEPFKLLIIDSVMCNLRSDYVGRGELSERQQRLGQYLKRLKCISEEFNIAVLMTNQVMADPSGGMTFVQDPKKPIGGHVLAHASTVRLSLRKGRGEQRVIKVVDHPCMPEDEASFAITKDGVADFKD
eukprot:jgi/Ulvmu1/8034/UM004_0271.1